MANQSKYIPCLDGLRALSIMLVMVFHSFSHQTSGFPHFWFPFGGASGVSLFFIISGYLITTLLLSEREKCGKISLFSFYIRRSLRIFPPFYAFLLTVVVLSACGQKSVSGMAVFASGAYWMNFYSGESGALGHTWSLSIEEQFYLVWPFLVARLPRRRALAFAIVGILAWPLLRFARHGYFYAPVSEEALRCTGLDTILWGAVLAMLAYGPTPGWLRRLHQQRWPLPLALLCLVCIYSYKDQWPSAYASALPLLRNVSLTTLLWWSVNNAKSWWGRLLELPAIAYVGKLSYSLYLWHGLFIRKSDHWLYAFPLNWVLSFVAAWASYHLLELPFNRYREKFKPGRPSLDESDTPGSTEKAEVEVAAGVGQIIDQPANASPGYGLQQSGQATS